MVDNGWLIMANDGWWWETFTRQQEGMTRRTTTPSAHIETLKENGARLWRWYWDWLIGKNGAVLLAFDNRLAQIACCCLPWPWHVMLLAATIRFLPECVAVAWFRDLPMLFPLDRKIRKYILPWVMANANPRLQQLHRLAVLSNSHEGQVHVTCRIY